MRIRRTAITTLVLLLTCFLCAQENATAALSSGDKLMDQRKFEEAFKVFEKASKASGQRCSECFFKMAQAKMRMNDASGAKKFAGKAVEVAQTPTEKMNAYAMQGEILLAFAGNNKKDAAQAEDAYRAVLKESPNAAILHTRIGTCLVYQDRLDDARKEFQAFLDMVPDSKDAALVRRWVENPARARYVAAPQFEFTSLKGESISLSQLTGKVVLLDFWGTWCPPCRASVPELKEVAKKYPADKLVVISVSSDEDEAKWRQFIAEHQMDWVQYRDADNRIQSAFHVDSFPTYIVIDKDGSIRERISGLDEQQSLRNRINDVLKKIL